MKRVYVKILISFYIVFFYIKCYHDNGENMKKKILIIILVLSLLVISAVICTNILVKGKNTNRTDSDAALVNEIKSHYNEYVKTNNESILYKYQNGEYIAYGKINKDICVSLESQDISKDTKYFHLKDFDLYIDYKYVFPSELEKLDSRYKNYILFNYNIITKSGTSFYSFNDDFLFSINDSFEFQVYVMDDERYGVEYLGNLYYIHKTDVEELLEHHNTDEKNKKRIRTLTYHFIYDENSDTCDQEICQSLTQFESHLNYIKENNYFTLKLNELEMYLDGKIQIPEKSIVLTIDDGTVLNLKALELLEKYEANATLFVITGWVDPNSFKSEYLDLESHTDSMHNQYECPGYGLQGGGILCLPEEKVLSDLKLSQDKLGGSVYFSYPFFDFNDRAIKLLKEAGFHMAFIGQYDTEGYSYPGVTDKYKVRRMTIFSSTNLNDFEELLQ